MEEKIYLRRVKETDMKLLFDWRNNELVRKNSFCMDPVEWNEHVKWFNTTLVKSSVLFFILICKEQEVGQIRIDLELDNTAIINYSIAEKYRGLGYGKQILHLAETELYERFKNKYMLKALVKENNISSQVAFERLGYILQNTNRDIFKTYIKILECMVNNQMKICFKERIFKEMNQFNMRQPFIIAEMSGNHNQSLNRALEIVDLAAEAGVDALKIQTYTADTMTIDKNDGEFFIEDKRSLWKGESLYSLYQKAYTPWEWHQAIFQRCKEKGIIGFSTPFDFSSVDFLEELDVPFYKIASFENVDLPLIKKVAQTGKPIIASTGMASLAELGELVSTARENGCMDLTLLKCTSSYPATPEGSNLLTIPHMRELFDCKVGVSDHTLGIGAAIASIALGATVIEKHFTISRADGGVDAAFSLEPQEMKQLVMEAKAAHAALGSIKYGINEQEQKSLQFRRSLYIVEDMQAGDVISERNMRSIRPGLGLAPKYYDILLGKKVKENVKRGTALTWDMI